MFKGLEAPPEKKRLNAKIPEELLEEVRLLHQFIQEVEQNENVDQSHVVEYVLREYFDSQRKEVKQYRAWKRGEWPLDATESGEEKDDKDAESEPTLGEASREENGLEEEPETGEFEIEM